MTIISHTPIAFLALMGLVFFAVRQSGRKAPYEVVSATILVAALIGPEYAHLKFPLFPELDKGRLPGLTLFLIAVFKWRHHIVRARWVTLWEVLLIVGFVGSLGTALTNTDTILTGPSWRRVVLPGYNLKGGIHDGLLSFLEIGVPFLLGRWFFRDPKHLDHLLRYMVLLGLIQSVFCCIELRLSPQLHQWVYGFTPTTGGFAMTIRWGGWRPNNFMRHGLAVSMFMLAAFLAATTLVRADPTLRLFRYRWRIKRVALWLGVITVLCKSTGAILYMAILAPMVRLAKNRSVIILSVVLVAITAAYPLLRSRDLIPTDDILAWATENIGADRAQSLEFRFTNEQGLLKHARDRYWLGWGHAGRNFVFDDGEGNMYLIADGYWVIVLSISGLVGYIHAFGLLVGPVLLAARRYVLVRDPALQTKLVGLCAIVAIQTFDYIPNGLFTPYPYLFAGALVGFSQEARKPGGAWQRLPSA